MGYIYQHAIPGHVFYIGGLVTLIGYVNQFTSVFHDVAWQYTQIVQYSTDVKTAVNIEDAYSTQHRPDRQDSLPQNWQRMEIRSLNFSHLETYNQQHPPQSLHDLQFKLERGKRIAFIGESGSGKSTLLSLMRGLYEPEPGSVFLIDGKEHPLDNLNQTVTLFPQEPEIFENTILYNITLGLPVSEEEIKSVCQSAHFTDVIVQLPRGLQSNIQEKGVNLSGGQKQRLALARGILAAKESEVVLLDEPTSSVDPKTESKIYENLFSIFSGKAVLSSLHRLHLLHLFDHIYVLQQGSIVADGTFIELRDHNKAFQDLWRHQEQIHKKNL